MLGTLAAGASQKLMAEQSMDISVLYGNSDATALAGLVRKGEVTAMELLEEAIRRTELANPDINAVTLKHYELARDYLKRHNPPGGPFAGVPFLLKDLGVQLAGTTTTGGSRILQGLVADRDSALVQRYKQAGLVIFGKTNTPEFGMALTTEPDLFGPCRNPWNLEHSVAGSSGGSAAAVAAGIVPIAHATDGGGSIRVPASACGVFGFKPTRALTGGGDSPAGFSVAHVVTRSVRDSAAMLDASAGSVAGAYYGAPGAAKPGGYLAASRKPPARVRVALNLTEPAVAVDPEVEQAVRRCAATLETLGHSVEEATPGIDYAQLNAAQEVLMMAEFAQGMRGLEQSTGRTADAHLEPLSVHFMETGNAYTSQQYLDSWQTSATAAQQVAEFHQTWDIMLQPVTATPPPRLNVIDARADDDYRSFVDRFRKYSAYTHLQNMTGQPSASIPMGLTTNGLPLAAMVSSGAGTDAMLMSLCAQLEAALEFSRMRPPAFRA